MFSDLESIQNYLEIQREIIFDYLLRLQKNGSFKYCLRGNLVSSKIDEGHFTSSFIIRAFIHLNKIEIIDKKDKEYFIATINHLQNNDGLITDKWLLSKIKFNLPEHIAYLLGRRAKPITIKIKKQKILFAETRQDLPILLALGKIPSKPIKAALKSKTAINNFFNDLDWSNPWDAGSHFSHQIVFLKINDIINDNNNNKELIAFSIELLNTIRNEIDGTWHIDCKQNNIKINGAMKIFSALQWFDNVKVDKKLNERLFNLALLQPNSNDGCGFFNNLFVIYNCIKYDNSLLSEFSLLQYLQNIFVAIKKFQREDGGYSFYSNKSQTKFYGAVVSEGYLESDLHGTSMITWAFVIISNLIEMQSNIKTNYKFILN
jgi:hypothetical protein